MNQSPWLIRSFVSEVDQGASTLPSIADQVSLKRSCIVRLGKPCRQFERFAAQVEAERANWESEHSASWNYARYPTPEPYWRGRWDWIELISGDANPFEDEPDSAWLWQLGWQSHPENIRRCGFVDNLCVEVEQRIEEMLRLAPRTPRSRGLGALFRGEARRLNPFPEWSHDHRAWDSGWLRGLFLKGYLSRELAPIEYDTEGRSNRLQVAEKARLQAVADLPEDSEEFAAWSEGWREHELHSAFEEARIATQRGGVPSAPFHLGNPGLGGVQRGVAAGMQDRQLEAAEAAGERAAKLLASSFANPQIDESEESRAWMRGWESVPQPLDWRDRAVVGGRRDFLIGEVYGSGPLVDGSPILSESFEGILVASVDADGKVEPTRVELSIRTIEAAEEEGWAAVLAGKAPNENPYSPGSSGWALWQRGAETIHSEARRAASRDGWDACIRGDAFDSNPLIADSAESEAWARGWSEAHKLVERVGDDYGLIDAAMLDDEDELIENWEVW